MKDRSLSNFIENLRIVKSYIGRLSENYDTP